MKFSSTSTHESKTCEGVTYKLRKFTEGRRIKMALALAPSADKITDLRSEMAELNAKFRPMVEDARRKTKEHPEQKEEIERELDSKLASDPDFVRIDKFNAQIRRIEDNEMNPEYVKHLLIGVEGLEIDGNEKPSVEQMVEDGPRELYDEIASHILRELGLSKEEQGNSESPGTSAAPATPATISTTAAGANTQETGSIAAA
jgi:hypothetical protein